MYLERDWLTSCAVRYLRRDGGRTGYTAHRREGHWDLQLPDGNFSGREYQTLDDVEQQIANIELDIVGYSHALNARSHHGRP